MDTQEIKKRKLASIQEVLEVKKHPNADLLDVITVLGWEAVVPKETLKAGDRVVYFEIDSMVPIKEWVPEAVKKRSTGRTKGRPVRISTMKIRDLLSQGLAVPLSDVHNHSEESRDFSELGTDLTKVLGIDKYEPPCPFSSFQRRGGPNKQKNVDSSLKFPAHIVPKTDELRLQSNLELLDRIRGQAYDVTLKMDGSSSTHFYDPLKEELVTCSRNLIVPPPEEGCINPNSVPYRFNVFRRPLEKALKQLHQQGMPIVIQGELVGPKFNGNLYNLKENYLVIFHVFRIESQPLSPEEGGKLSRRRVNYTEMKKCYEVLAELTQEPRILLVPRIEEGESFGYTLHELLAKATMSLSEMFGLPFEPLSKGFHEGIVVRSQLRPDFSFKVVSNEYLLKTGR